MIPRSTSTSVFRAPFVASGISLLQCADHSPSAACPQTACLRLRPAVASHNSRAAPITSRFQTIPCRGRLEEDRSMKQRTRLVASVVIAAVLAGALGAAEAAPEGTLTIAVATFAGERWLPHLYPGAEDVVLKPMFENLLTRDPKTGELAPMLAERWQVVRCGGTRRYHQRRGIRFHGGKGELTAEDVRFTFAAIAKEGSANSLAPEFRAIKSIEVEDRHTLAIRFDKPAVAFGNKVTQGLF